MNSPESKSLLTDRQQSLLDGFPDLVSPPKLKLGDRVRWRPLPAEDFGSIIGIEYAQADHLEGWGWRYTVWLDARSPSSAWTQTDVAWEDDLLLLETEESSG